jgi:hypothetical protein
MIVTSRGRMNLLALGPASLLGTHSASATSAKKGAAPSVLDARATAHGHSLVSLDRSPSLASLASLPPKGATDRYLPEPSPWNLDDHKGPADQGTEHIAGLRDAMWAFVRGRLVRRGEPRDEFQDPIFGLGEPDRQRLVGAVVALPRTAQAKR